MSQLVVILARTELNELNDGYLILQNKRKSSVRSFVDAYLINKDKPTEYVMFCPLFGEFPNSYDNAWMSKVTRQSVVDYVTFIRSEAKDIIGGSYEDCTHQMLNCKDRNNCRVTIQYQDDAEIYHDVDSMNAWTILFSSSSEITLTVSIINHSCPMSFKLSILSDFVKKILDQFL